MSKLAITRRGGYHEYKVQYLEKVPLKSAKGIVKEGFSKLTYKRIQLTELQYKLKHTYQRYIQSQFSIEKLTRNLQKWEELDFGEFIKELKKAIKKTGSDKLTRMDEIEWMEVFETKKAEAQSLQVQITKIDKEIDAMVYELYGLTDKEIAIVENS